MRIGFATADWSMSTDPPSLGGAGYYRIGLAAQSCDNAPVGFLISRNENEFGIATHNDEQLWGFDIIVMQRYMNHDLPHAIRRARANGQIIINDVDDWYEGLSPQNQAFQASHPTQSPANNRNHYRATLLASSALTVSTPFLAQRYAAKGVPVSFVRNRIDLDRWTANPQPWATPTIGWVGATGWRSGDLQILRGILGSWLEKNGARFHHSGHRDDLTPAAELLGLPNTVEVTTMNMAPIDRYPTLFRPIDVGLVPLADIGFNHAKSAIKGMEYAAAGIPFIASPTPEYCWLLEKHGIGRIARKPRDWLRHLDALADRSVRQAEALQNRERLAALDVTAPEWPTAYRSVASLQAC